MTDIGVRFTGTFTETNNEFRVWLFNVIYETHRIQSIHYSDVIMSVIASQITGVSIVCSTVCWGADQRKHQSSASLAFVRGIHRWPVDSRHKGPVTRKTFPFDDVFILLYTRRRYINVGQKCFRRSHIHHPIKNYYVCIFKNCTPKINDKTVVYFILAIDIYWCLIFAFFISFFYQWCFLPQIKNQTSNISTSLFPVVLKWRFLKCSCRDLLMHGLSYHVFISRGCSLQRKG